MKAQILPRLEIPWHYFLPRISPMDQRKVILQHPDVKSWVSNYVDLMVKGRIFLFLSRTAYDDGVWRG